MSYQPRTHSGSGYPPRASLQGAPIRTRSYTGPQPINKSAMDNLASDYDVDKDKRSRNIMIGIASVSILGKLYLYCLVE